MSGTAFVDISFTDGQSAAWGGALATPMLLGAATSLGNAGLAAIEALSPAVIAQCLARGEHPLQRLDTVRERAGATPLRVAVSLLPEHGRFDVLEGDLLDAWLRLLARHGATEVLLVDPLMDMARLAAALRATRDAGLQATAALAYAEDACDDGAYAQQAECLVAAGAARVMLRDESGLLHLDRVATLVPALRTALGATPLDLHTRCHTGLAPQVVLEAVRLGVARIDTALPCVAHGASAPPLPLLVRSAALLGLAVQAPEGERIAEAQARLAAVAEQEGFAPGQPWAFDLAPYTHQLPGEVAAEAMQSLRRRGRWADLHAYAHECERIRQDLGAPPMRQPFASAIAAQAFAHLDGESRYATLQPALRRTLQGAYGELGPMDAALRQRVGRIDAPRAPAEVPRGDDALLALVAGIAPAEVPLRQALRYETLTPEQALARGLLQRWTAWAGLSVTGPGLAIRLDQSKG